jgi:hypothetical protein
MVAALRRQLVEGAQVRADRDRRVVAAWSKLDDDLERRPSPAAGLKQRG